MIGGHINGLGLVRALAAGGVPAAVICTESHDMAHRSNAVVGWARAPHLGAQPEQLTEVMAQRAREWAGWALLPSNDDALLAVEHARAALGGRHPLGVPAAGIIPQALDKRFMRDLATRTGLSLPAHYGAALADNPLLDELQYPVVVKPRRSQPFGRLFGRKLFIVHDRAALDIAIGKVERMSIPCTLDEWIPGGDDQLITVAVYLARDGAVTPAVCYRKLRQGPPFSGVARVAELPPPAFLPERDRRLLQDGVVELLRAIGFQGPAAAEFKRDARTGAWRFIEVNIRSVLPNRLLRAGGFDTAMLWYTELTTGRVPQVQPTAWPGVWVNLHADLLYTVARRRDDPIPWRRFVAPYRRPVIDAVWSARDPRPVLTQWAYTARRGLRAASTR